MTVATTRRPEIPLQMQVVTNKDIRASIKRARKGLEAAAEEIVWQVEVKAWIQLDYSSWNEMREAEYGGAAVMVPTGSRERITRRLKAIPVGRTARGGSKHLTDQEIADTVGVSRRQVQDDLNENNEVCSSAQNVAPSPEADGDVVDAEIVEDDEPIHVNTATGEVIDPDETTDPVAAESVATVTCPTCHGTGKVTR